MADVVSLRPEIVDIAKASIIKAGITPNVDPIRGGTDGSNLSFIGLPCPNLFTGGHNFHGRYEYVCADSMIKAVEVVVNIIDEVSKQK
jgi:tripeptide aminopeptidase